MVVITTQKCGLKDDVIETNGIYERHLQSRVAYGDLKATQFNDVRERLLCFLWMLIKVHIGRKFHW